MFSINNIFGYSEYVKLKIGDLVSWSEVTDYNGLAIPEKIKKIGVISSLYLAYRGDRQVALAKVLQLSDGGNEKEILVISLEIVNKTRESLNM